MAKMANVGARKVKVPPCTIGNLDEELWICELIHVRQYLLIILNITVNMNDGNEQTLLQMYFVWESLFQTQRI